MVYSAPCVASADTGFTIDFAGTVNYGGIDTTTNMIDLGSGRFAFTMADYQVFQLADTYSFQAGYWYSGEFLFEVRTGLANSETSVVCTLSIGNYSSVLRGSCTTDHTGYGVCYVPFDFCPDASFDTNMITLELSMSGVPDYGLGTVRPCTVTVQTSDDHQTSAIGGFFNGLWEKLSGAFDKVGGWFSALGDRIQGFFTQLIEDIKGLFVPSDGFFEEQQQLIQDTMTDRFGMVAQAGELVRTLGDKFEAVSGQPSVIFPEVSWDGTVIIPETVVPLMPDGFSFIQPIVRQVTTLVLCLVFLNMLKNQFSLFVGAYAEIDQLTSQQSDE